MNILDVIEKKKNKKQLSSAEIQFFIDGYVNDTIKDYQASALLMAIRINGLDFEETLNLTKSMLYSGEVIDLHSVEGYKVDKHSTGGIGDKVTLIVAPIVAALGVKVAKLSGRGLGITGGTLDKLEAIDGVSIDLTEQQFIDQVNTIGFAIAGQTQNLVPADKKLYALRDVTGTVDSLPLIASSIMSKKLASGADGMVIDVKYGSGAFCKTMEVAQELAEIMIKIAEGFDKSIVTVLSSMNNPLGRTVGNKNEVKEAYDLLLDPDHADENLLNTIVEVSTYMYEVASKNSHEHSKQAVLDVLHSNLPVEKFEAMIHAQRLSNEQVDINLTFEAKNNIDIPATEAGYVKAIDAETIGHISLELGAGRHTKEDVLDFNAGVELLKVKGDYVEVGDIMMKIYSDSAIDPSFVDKAQNAVEYSSSPVEKLDAKVVLKSKDLL
ncbi:thymidine phosphorylase [Kurthia sibirica]|uniref:Pyrimidine-nucleoside phosphorylase n=1 Tax=Kurthia sibirica TaxID=202750 RepID=A0A2U3AR73_9BACL|nr:thymidine phosphorylase [Kurthia sibirica]PWI27009.1 thymidine phosphorylase [Kurthia sibirica]GEK34447.1 pyrimidine-nucleoside phosphorylase [Kurthia sibirica]